MKIIVSISGLPSLHSKRNHHGTNSPAHRPTKDSSAGSIFNWGGAFGDGVTWVGVVVTDEFATGVPSALFPLPQHFSGVWMDHPWLWHQWYVLPFECVICFGSPSLGGIYFHAHLASFCAFSWPFFPFIPFLYWFNSASMAIIRSVFLSTAFQVPASNRML